LGEPGYRPGDLPRASPLGEQNLRLPGWVDEVGGEDEEETTTRKVANIITYRRQMM
jgi:hypothetical protein